MGDPASKIAGTPAMRESWTELPRSLGCVRRFSGLGRCGGFQLGQRFIHALSEVTLVVVLPSAIVRDDLHLTHCTLRYQGDVVGPLEGRSANIDMSGVLHIVGRSHFGVVTLHDAVVFRIAKGVFDRAPHLAARN